MVNNFTFYLEADDQNIFDFETETLTLTVVINLFQLKTLIQALDVKNPVFTQVIYIQM